MTSGNSLSLSSRCCRSLLLAQWSRSFGCDFSSACDAAGVLFRCGRRRRWRRAELVNLRENVHCVRAARPRRPPPARHNGGGGAALRSAPLRAQNALSTAHWRFVALARSQPARLRPAHTKCTRTRAARARTHSHTHRPVDANCVTALVPACRRRHCFGSARPAAPNQRQDLAAIVSAAALVRRRHATDARGRAAVARSPLVHRRQSPATYLPALLSNGLICARPATSSCGPVNLNSRLSCVCAELAQGCPALGRVCPDWRPNMPVVMRSGRTI
jgi:hypothetical protein